MPRSPSANFTATKNAQTNAPIWLYRVNISDTPDEAGEGDLYLAEYQTNVAYYETNGGVSTARTYLAWPIEHEGVSENTNSQVDSLTMKVSNISREMQAYLEQRDGLRGRKVTIRQVFAEYLNDPLAHIEDIYYIDSVTASGRSAEFTLTGNIDIMDVKLPRRKYLRNFCQWKFKGFGCWVDDGDGTFSEPTNFSTQDQLLYSPVAASEEKKEAVAEVEFHPRDLRKMDVTADYILVSMRCAAQESGGADYNDLLADATGVESYLKLATAQKINGTTTGKNPDNDYYRFSIDPTDINGKAISDEWQEFTIPLTGWTVVGAGMLFRYASYFAWVQEASQKVVIEWRNAKVRYTRAYSFLDRDTQCPHTLAACRLYNNEQRFGGFPDVPSKRKLYT